MAEFRVENHLSHKINIIPGNQFPEQPPQSWPERSQVPRADEATVAIIGIARVMGCDVPVLHRRYTHLIHAEGIPYDRAVLKVVSHETIAAAARDGRPIHDLAYPIGLVRDERGNVLGCTGFGRPVWTEPAHPPEIALTRADMAMVEDPARWANLGNVAARFYDPRAVATHGDTIDTVAHPSLLELPPAAAPVDIHPNLSLYEQDTEQFGVPVFGVQPGDGPDAITNLPPPEDRESLQFIHPLALRHAALLGQSTRFCVTVGRPVRDCNSNTVVGGTAIYVLDPDMLARDGI